MSSEHPAYNPFSYHRGSVWPVEAATFAHGLARYGFWDECHRIVEGMVAASELFPEGRLPEALGGIARDDGHPHPGLYPASNDLQGWSASAIVQLITTLLGLRTLAPLGLLLLDPHLPPWLPDLRIEGIRVGAARVDLRLWCEKDGETRYRVLRREGSVRVVRRMASPRGTLALLGASAGVLRGEHLL